MPSVFPDHLKAQWGGRQRLYQDRPILGVLTGAPTMFLFIAYPALIALLTWLDWFSLKPWFDLFAPAIGMLRRIFPVFDRLELTFLASGHENRLAEFHHVFAVELLLGTSLFVTLSAMLLTLRRDEWMQFVTAVPLGMLCLGCFVCLIIFIWGISWITLWGAADSPPPYDGYALIWSGFMFGCTIVAGLAFLDTLGAMIVGLHADITGSRE